MAGRSVQELQKRTKFNNMRSDRMRGKESTNAEKRTAEKAAKEAEEGRWTIAMLLDQQDYRPGGRMAKIGKSQLRSIKR